MTDPGISEATPSLPALSGRVLDGRYRIDALVGAGGMGVVYAAWHIKLEKRVAIKILDPRFADRPDAVKRFLREARSASKISHRNVVEVMDFGQSDDLVYFVMEFLEGADLAAVIRRSAPLPWPRAKQILVQIVRALKAAHTQGIVHRDIKPANCFVVKTPDDEPDVVKVLDFGIAKVVDPGTHTDGLTSTSQVIGTALYMAPEQAMGKPIDARTDVYALGTMAFEMVSGRKPFVGATGFEVLMKRVNEPPPSVCDHEPSLDPGVDTMIQCAMSRDPDKRFQSMRAFEEALLELPGGHQGQSGEGGHIALVTDDDVAGGPPSEVLSLRQTADGLPRSADSGTSTMTANRAADATPRGLGMPLSGPIGATEAGPPLAVPPAEPSLMETKSAPLVESEVRVLGVQARGIDESAVVAEDEAAPATGRRWWPIAAVVLLGLAGAGIWMSREPGAAGSRPATSAAVAGKPVDESASTRAVGAPKHDLGLEPGGAETGADVPDPIDEPGADPTAAPAAEPPAAPAAEPPVVDAEPSAPAKTGKKKKKKGSRKPKPPPTRAAALSGLGKRAKKRCTAEAGTKVSLDVFVSATGTLSTPRDRGSTAGADAVSCVTGVVKGSTIPSGVSELRRVTVSF